MKQFAQIIVLFLTQQEGVAQLDSAVLDQT
jgi:hypothetical protein